jgi:hypothetical protein
MARVWSSLRLGPFGPLPVVSLAVLAGAVAAATYLVGTGAQGPEPAAPAAARAPESLHGAAPAAAEFAREFTGITNQYATQSGDGTRIAQVDCVQASRGHYMCSYAILRPSQPAECHVMQAVWTPTDVSSFKVTLSGRSTRCASLRDALHSLQ